MLQQVPTIKTTPTKQEFTSMCLRVWAEQNNAIPTQQQIAILFAQWGLETNYGANCYCFNFGNVKAVDNPTETIEYCALNGVFEYINGQKVIIPPTNPGAWFRAFNSLQEGMEFYLGFLRNGRYKAAWQAVEDGSPQEFVHQLKVAGYFTAPEASYLALEMEIFNDFMSKDYYTLAVEAFNGVAFPPTFLPVDNIEVPVITDTFNNTNATPSVWQNILNKIKSIF